MNRTQRTIVGLVGKIAAGKKTVSDRIAEGRDVTELVYSDSLKEALSIFDIEATRKNQQDISTILRERFGEDILARAMRKKVMEHDGLVVIDGIRRLTDYESMKDMPGFSLVFIDADLEIRFERYRKRNQSPGDKSLTLEKFKILDQAETEQQIAALKPKADFVIENDAGLKELREQTDRAMDAILSKK